ncbi:SDR family oxidoreductase [Peribacillus frigoritolerans]|uniref:SDR family NAD(P)-dependent oxidoreductase n=1 Tax=Peribacillus frigoritolerans TaxID=450367 RepID=UPI0021CF3827|nr:SDR family NAD(P)-dependent oxidoreductase [Peribacillus frigoritolerans]MCU6598952.1 SDR family oxidoreductase [Peribacillus frigoritolerans]
MKKLTGKTALITGGAGGIGKATASAFLKEGANIVLVDLFAESLAAVCRELDAPDHILTIKADVSKEFEVENYVLKTVESFGKIDVFFNNAGIEGKVAPIVSQSVEDFDKVMNVNVRGVFLGLKHVLPIMTKQGYGSIINMSSVAGLMGVKGSSAYTASKHAVTGLTKVAALEAAKTRVRVNSIHPSPVNTRMMESLENGANSVKPEAVHKQYIKGIPLGKYGEPSDIAKLVLFLASDDSAFITGSQYRIDGGMGAL